MPLNICDWLISLILFDSPMGLISSFPSQLYFVHPSLFLSQSTKLQEDGWKPRWFRRENEQGTYRYVGGYWEAREVDQWEGCPNIFGELSNFNDKLWNFTPLGEFYIYVVSWRATSMEFLYNCRSLVCSWFYALDW